MFRAFKVTLPADTNNHNLYSLIVGSVSGTNPFGYGVTEGGTNETGITGAIPLSGLFPDRVGRLEIIADIGNTSTLSINDRNYTNTTGKVLNAGDVYLEESDRNTLCIKDYFIQGGANSQALEVTIEIR